MQLRLRLASKRMIPLMRRTDLLVESVRFSIKGMHHFEELTARIISDLELGVLLAWSGDMLVTWTNNVRNEPHS